MKEDSELILESEVKQNSWKIRPCHIYKDEYKECRSIKGRFQQYFVYGEILDCSSYAADVNDCINFEDKGDYHSAKRIINNEDRRRKDRMQGHLDNDVWNKRSKPPDDFNKPLPEFITKRYENSYLEMKNKEMKGEAPPDQIKEPSYCVLM